MANCKADFLEVTDSHDVLCADIQYGHDYWDVDIKKRSVLKVGYSKSDFNLFLKSLDYDYNDGYGSQEVFGIIWYKDGTWAERAEYDGSEWWTHKICPEIPSVLK